MFAKDFKASAEVHLLPKGPRQPGPLQGQAEQTITSCCCCSQGTVALQVNSPMDVITAGQGMEMTAKVSHGSSLESFLCTHLRVSEGRFHA